MVKKGSVKTISLPVGIAIGVLVCFVVTLAGCAVVSWLIAGEHMAEDSVGIAAMVMLLIAAATGSLTASTAIKTKGLPVCMITGAGYYLLLLACTALFFGGQYHGVILSGLMILAGSGLVALLGLKGRKGAKRRFKIPAYR